MRTITWIFLQISLYKIFLMVYNNYNLIEWLLATIIKLAMGLFSRKIYVY